MSRKQCGSCNAFRCHGECENYLIDMIEHSKDRLELERLFKEIPKFNYAMNFKINSIFGTDLEVAKNSELSTAEDERFNQFIYKSNENGKTNLSEIKSSLKEKEIFGISYLFFDNNNLYFLKKDEVTEYLVDDEDPILKKISFFAVGNVDIESVVDDNDTINFGKDGFIKQKQGYIISKSNMIILKSDSYVLNSDLKQLQILLEINRKICDSTTKRDYGDLFLFTNSPIRDVVSSVATRVKNTASDTIKKMRERIASLIKKNKVDDSNIVVLDESYKDVKQFAPITKVTDYEFIWKNQDEIIASVFNFPTILLGLGESSGNISKEALIKDARANMLTPLKADTANSLSIIAKKMFGEEYYIRFKDYEEVVI